MRRFLLIGFLLIASCLHGQGNDGNTVLLLHSDYAVATTTIVDSSVFGASSPHALTNVGAINDTVTSKFGSSSIYFFDDSLTASSSPDFDFGTGDFTFDSWVRIRPGTTYDHFFSLEDENTFSVKAEKSSTRFYVVSLDNDTYSSFGDIVATYTPETWQHLAVVRASGTLYIFVDGNLAGTSSFSYDLPQKKVVFGFGQAGQYLRGYLDEVRVSNVARWTSNFTVATEPYSIATPTPPVYTTATGAPILFSPGGLVRFGQGEPDELDSNYVHLLHFNASTTEAAVGADWAEQATPDLSTDVYKFGGGAFSPRASEHIVTNLGYYASGTVPFTLDYWLWINPTASGTQQWTYGYWSGLTFQQQIYLNANQLTLSIDNNAAQLASYVVPAFEYDRWYHIAVSYDSATASMYIDGVSVMDVDVSGGFGTTPVNKIIGNYQIGGGSAGIMLFDEWRFSDVARYSGNFTPPTREYDQEGRPTITLGPIGE